MNHLRRVTLLGLVLFLVTARTARADTYAILVAPKDSPAYSFAKGRAADATVFVERRLHRALARAAELLQSGEHTARILVAQGAFTAKANQGTWVIPHIDNPAGTLHLVGGYNDDFSGRQPFTLPSVLVTASGRSDSLLSFTKKSRLKEVVISGLLFDAAVSNAYDKKTNSILKGQSRTYPLLSFSLLKTDRLVVADNIFMNGAHGAFDPYIQPLSANTVVDISNNVFFNNIKTMSVGAGKAVAAINLRHNTFYLNWPYNPDATSSNVSALELYHRGGASQVTIEGNLFAFNAGGAMQHDWPEDRMPRLTIKDNLFHMNAALFEYGAAGAGVFVGKLGLNPKYLILDLETVEDDFDYDVGGNVTLDPKIPIAMADLQAADSYSVKRLNTVLNDVRRLFGLNQDGGTVAIANYAPAMAYQFPMPTEEQAKAYGAQPGKLWGQ